MVASEQFGGCLRQSGDGTVSQCAVGCLQVNAGSVNLLRQLPTSLNELHLAGMFGIRCLILPSAA
jgi:hypothetical protein